MQIEEAFSEPLKAFVKTQIASEKVILSATAVLVVLCCC